MESEMTSLLYHGSENVQVDETSPSLIEKLEMLSPVQPQYTMYKVHDELRSIKGEAYEPKLIAIGPYHSHKENLKKMETHKLRYLSSFLEREETSVEECISVIEKRELEARECYAEFINLNQTKFIEMLVLDACFIIEFVLRFNFFELREDSDPLFQMHWMVLSIKRDLALFENQIPFFVIYELFNLIDGRSMYGDLTRLLLEVYSSNYPPKVSVVSIESSIDIKHLLELIHRSLVLAFEDQDSVEVSTPTDQKECHDKCKLTRKGQDIISSAIRLAESNVKFKPTKGVSLFQIDFKNGCMRLPHLVIEDNTESFFRNLIAYEQYFIADGCCYVTDYVTFMDCLINTQEDVKLLIKHGIIENWLGSEEAIVDIVNKLTDGVLVFGSNFIYKLQFVQVINHCSHKRNAWMAKLKRNHTNTPWAIISIIAACVLLALTVVQTVFTILK